MDKKLSKKQIFGAIGAGILVGFVNGFLGAGGGMLVVPLMRLIFKESPKKAHSTAVLIMLPICLISSIVYLLQKQIEFNIIWQVGIGTIVGGVLGTFLLCKLKNKVITFLFSLVMIGAGLFMIFG